MLNILLGLAWYVLVVAGAWQMFEKAGEAGWKALIPFYNVYVCYQFSWQTVYFWVWLVLNLLAGWVSYYAMGSEFNSILLYVIDLVALFINATLAYRVSLAFGHGIGYAFGLTFLPFVFTLIIGFGSDRYVGNPSNTLRY